MASGCEAVTKLRCPVPKYSPCAGCSGCIRIWQRPPASLSTRQSAGEPNVSTIHPGSVSQRTFKMVRRRPGHRWRLGAATWAPNSSVIMVVPEGFDDRGSLVGLARTSKCRRNRFRPNRAVYDQCAMIALVHALVAHDQGSAGTVGKFSGEGRSLSQTCPAGARWRESVEMPAMIEVPDIENLHICFAHWSDVAEVIEWILKLSSSAPDPSVSPWPLTSGCAACAASSLRKSSSRNFFRRWSAAMHAQWRCSVA